MSFVRPIIQCNVYTRPIADGYVAAGWKTADWFLDYNLRADLVSSRVGPETGHAEISWHPIGVDTAGEFEDASIEAVLSRYSTDQDVLITALPEINPVAGQPAAGERVLFAGLLMRHNAVAQADATGASETISFTALAYPWLDNQAFNNIVRGPIMAVPVLDEEGKPKKDKATGKIILETVTVNSPQRRRWF